MIAATKDVSKCFTDNRTIACQSALVYPQPSLAWYKNGVIINNRSAKHNIVDGYFTSYLILKSNPIIQTGDIYNCTAINDAGESTANFKVTSKGAKYCRLSFNVKFVCDLILQ